MTDRASWIAAMFVLATAAAAPAAGPAERPLSIPAKWVTFEIDWKPTWAQTLAAHPENKWNAELKKDPATAPHAGRIGMFRRIELLKAMMKRWPQDRQKHVEAYTEIGKTYYRLGWHWWHSYWGWKLVQDFPDNPAAVQRGYQMVLTWSFGQYTHWGWFGYWVRPECRDWEFAIDEVIARHAAGKLADGPAVRTAWSYRTWMYVDFVDYGRFHPTLTRLAELGKSDPSYHLIAEQMLRQFGHRADGVNPDILYDEPRRAREARDELRMRWEAAQHSDLFRDVSKPADAEVVQKLLDLIAVTDAHQPEGDKRIPLWTLLDRRLTSLPEARVAPLAAAQQQAARGVATAAQMTGDRGDLLQAFRRYPFATCVHELMVDAAEQDLRKGLTRWAVPMLWDVVRHARDDRLRKQAVVGLWLALSQTGGDRRELDSALSLLGDDVVVPWRGREQPAGKIKSLFRIPDPDARRERSVTLATLKVRRVVLPRGWPARHRNLDGPVGDVGVHAPWPISQVEQVGTSLIVSGPTAVARYDRGRDDPVWVFHPPQRISDDGWPWNVPGARLKERSPYLTRSLHRRPVRALRRTTPLGDGRLYYLMNTVEPPIVVALDVFTGRPSWSTENGHGWEGLTPLSHPAASEGRVYVLAAPPDRRTKNWRAYPQTEPATIHLVCLNAANGRVLWKRPVGWRPESRLDLARGSNPVAVGDGVYCATNAGLIARSGAHDGILKWVHAYPSAVHQGAHAGSINPQRQGSGPLRVRPSGAGQTGAMILTAPRDHTGVLAFNQQTGRILWETPLTPSHRLVGATDKVVVGINDNWLAALDLSAGKQLYCREFSGGTDSAAVMIGSDVILATGGTLHRIQAATGKTLETRDLPDAAGAEVTLMPDGTVVQVVAPPLAPPPGPATAGRKLALPLKKVWSVPCQSPRVIFREDPTERVEDFAVISGRRVGYVKRSPNWRMTWHRLLRRGPQAAGLAGKTVLTADVWTLTGMSTEDGSDRWSTKLPILPAVVAGRGNLAYAAATGGWGGTPHYAVVNTDTGKLLWSRNVTDGWMHGPQATLMHAEPDGSMRLRVLSGLVEKKTGKSGFGEVQIDAVTGDVLRQRRITEPGENFWGIMDFDERGIGFYLTRGSSYWNIGRQIVMAVNHDGTRAVPAWKREFNMQSTSWHRSRMGVNNRPSGVWARMDGYLLRFDPADAKEIRYDLTRPGGAIQPLIFDFRVVGDRVVVVSGLLGLVPPQPNQKSPAWTPPDKWKMYVDIFDRATGKSLGRQQLPGVLCCVTNISYRTMAGYESQVRIGEDAIVISDIHGVHVFAGKK